ncbi:MAG: HAMP domain-containing sensor histidine kinase, partial [Pseudomonadota bacterium]
IEAVRRGASDYIAKDRLTPVAIHNAVRHCLERARLARELDEKQATLERTNTELRARNQEVESFYHSVSHELKTPLTALREFCALVSDEVLGPVTEAQREALDVSIACCDQLNRMVNDLFDTARIETGKLSLNTRSINLEELVEQELRVLQPKADVAHVTLDADFDRPLPRVNCDPHRIAQVLFNLVGNGIKHSGPGSTIRVQLCTSDDRRSLRIRVSDQGCGIPSDQLEQVFDRLFQVEAAAISAHAGMGVGLYLCRQIVELHGGTITVDSTEGVGSCFSFTLPVA